MPDPVQGIDTPIQSSDAQIQDDANQSSIGLLRSKNVKEFHSVLTFGAMVQWPNGKAIESATNVQFVNKGIFSAKWIIQQVKWHLMDGKLIADIEFRKCISADAWQTRPVQTTDTNTLGQ